ncbi:MAG: clostripain-related cysteine peptidase, partial [Bdellovibrionota bacterium]
MLLNLSMAAGAMGFFGTSAYGQVQTNQPAKKKWTMIVFMNGHSNLAQYTDKDINEMEAVGSDENRNIVVQWATESETQTHRMLIKKDADTTTITSPKIESMPRVDMGDYRELQRFLEWAIEKYPAEHYFVDVWNHGNGWMERMPGQAFEVNNISYDDISGNSISIPDLALALKAASEKAGKKIDIYGSDACLMAMAEVGSELAPYVETMVGSEEVEPLDGWEYTTFLNAWNLKPNATSHEIGQILADTYMESYATGYRGLTFSVVDLTQMEAFDNAFRDFSSMLTGKSAAEAKSILAA